MAIDAEALLAGPRGRRLCLEHACAQARASGGNAFDDTVMRAGHHLDPNPRVERIGFGLLPNPGRFSRLVSTLRREPALPQIMPIDMPEATASDVAQALARLPLAAPSDNMLMKALEQCVSRAHYWQPPDGEDVVAADPGVRRELARVAAHLLASPLTGWWEAGIDAANQWAVAWHDPDTGCDPAADPAPALCSWRRDQEDQEDRARRETAADLDAASSGEWWVLPGWAAPSTTRGLEDRGPTALRLTEDDSGWSSATATPVIVPETARIYEVHDGEAWAQLCRHRPLDVTASRSSDWRRTTGRVGAWVIPDFEAVAEEFDAVHVSVAGYLRIAGRAVPVTEEAASVLAGWGPDETRWFIPLAAEGRGAPRRPQHWQRQNGGAWHLKDAS